LTSIGGRGQKRKAKGGRNKYRRVLAVEAVMKAYAPGLGEDEQRWGIIGILHDFDYEMYPDPPDHPVKGSEILANRGRRSSISNRPLIRMPRMIIFGYGVFL
jgi:predicted hydrolase (HD superfamily)